MDGGVAEKCRRQYERALHSREAVGDRTQRAGALTNAGDAAPSLRSGNKAAARAKMQTLFIDRPLPANDHAGACLDEK
jgi:hypothetical protein